MSIVAGETMTLQGDLLLFSGTTLALDIYDPNTHDFLDIQGNLDLNAGGTLELTLDPNAPALLAGDVFDVLRFASVAGAFDTLSLPTLGGGLVWNIADLYTTGELSVITDVDLDDDGLVTGLDLPAHPANESSSHLGVAGQPGRASRHGYQHRGRGGVGTGAFDAGAPVLGQPGMLPPTYSLVLVLSKPRSLF